MASIKLMYIIYEQCENKYQKYKLNCVKILNKSSEVDCIFRIQIDQNYEYEIISTEKK